MEQAVQHPLVMQSERIGHHDIKYVQAGTGEPLLLLHGINCGWRQWQESISELSNYFHVYALDLPGAGESSSVDWFQSDPEKEIGETIMGFIHKKGLTRVKIIAHSFTGWVILHLAVRYPQEIGEIMLVSPMGLTEYMPFSYRLLSIPFVAKLLARTVMKPTKKNMKNFLTSVVKNKDGVTDDFITQYAASVRGSADRHPFFLIHRLSRLLRAGELVLRQPLAVSQKTLVLIGGKDPLIPLAHAQKAFAFLPNAQVRIFEDSGHVPLIEDIPAFVNLVKTFFTRA